MRRAGLALSALLAAAPAGFAQTPGSPGNPRVPTPGSGQPQGVAPGGLVANPGGGVAPAPDPKLVAHLNAWQARTQGVSSLDTGVEFTRKNLLLKKESAYSGRIVCMKPNLAWMKITNKEPAKSQDFLSYICDGASVYEYNGAAKEVVQHRIPPGGKGGVGDNLLLEFMSGGMTAADIQQRFDLKLLKEEENYVHIQIGPRLPKDKQEFDSALLVLYRSKAAPQLDYLPAVVVMTKANGQEQEQWTFPPQSVKTNDPGIKKEMFAYIPPDPKAGWTVKPAAATVPADPRVVRPAAPGGK